MYATSSINKSIRESGVIPDKRQSLYSLRHWFQDQLTKLDVIDRAQAQLMGHRFHRPKYGYGKELSELRDIISQIFDLSLSSLSRADFIFPCLL